MEQNNSSELGLRLRIASERGKLQEVKRLLAAGAAVTRDTNGLTALHKAAKCGHSKVVKQLLRHKRLFSPNMQDKYGWAPLHWAAWNGNTSTIHTLVSQIGCLINVIDKTGSNAAHCAALNGHTGVIQTLTAVKCDINKQRKDGWTPLHLACWNGHEDVVHELIISKCTINIKTEEGAGPLHLAAAKGRDDIVQELLDANHAPDMQNKHGNTALHEAVRWRHHTTVKKLIEMECRINVKNLQGDTPMDIARKEGYNELITQLSGFANCNLEESFCSCSELRRIIFQEKGTIKTDKLKELKLFGMDSDLSSQLEKTHPTSESRVLQTEHEWQERLQSARAEVLARCESRIAEVEKQCKLKVAKIERQCSERLQAANAYSPTTTAPIHSAPGTVRKASNASSCSSTSVGSSICADFSTLCY